MVGETPFWSVMVPTYNSLQYLEETLLSVLKQAPEAAQMQIEVVDDCSDSAQDPAPLIDRIGQGRISLWRQPQRAGMAGNWNTCIQRARGKWVHILHADDYVLPGFYECLQTQIESHQNARPGAAFVRNTYLFSNGTRSLLSPLQMTHAGVLGSDWIRKQAAAQQIQVCAIVVKRAAYEECGYFRKDLRYTLDWEMWVRLGARCPFLYDPEPLAVYRMHESSETSRLKRAGRIHSDIARCLSIFEKTLAGDWVIPELRKARESYAAQAVEIARDDFYSHQPILAGKNLVGALRLDCGLNTVRKVINAVVWGLHGGAKVLRRRILNRVASRQAGGR